MKSRGGVQRHTCGDPQKTTEDAADVEEASSKYFCIVQKQVKLHEPSSASKSQRAPSLDNDQEDDSDGELTIDDTAISAEE